MAGVYIVLYCKEVDGCMHAHTCPYCLFDNTHTSAGFSIAAMTRAASSSFSHVFFKLIMAVPREEWMAVQL